MLEMSQATSQKVLLKIVDVTGKIMINKIIDVHAGNVIEKFDISNFNSGIYLVHLQFGNMKVVDKKIIIK